MREPTNIMAREIGNPAFPIWLLGDSNPLRWQEKLLTPLDPRHPVRHNIWTPILDVIQDKVYRDNRLRLDTTELYLRNAVADPTIKPKGSQLEWGPLVNQDCHYFGSIIEQYHPTYVFCFGAFAFEFARRAVGETPQRRFKFWGAVELGKKFISTLATFNPARVNLIPLLHRSISGGKFLESHTYFCNDPTANYFEVVGTMIAESMIDNKNFLEIWIDWR